MTSDIDSDSIVASCNCDTKTNDPMHHNKGCKYRLICERDAALNNFAEQCKINGSLIAANLQMWEALEKCEHARDCEWHTNIMCPPGPCTCGRDEAISTPPQSVVPLEDVKPLLDAITPLGKIYDAFLSDGLDEARPSWGDTTESAAAMELLGGRGGKQLLTLGDCSKAAQIVKAFTTKHPTL